MDTDLPVNQAAYTVTPGRQIPSLPMGGADVARARPMAIMQGDLRDYALSELLQFLQNLRKKGQLLIERPEPRESASVYFSAGRVVHAYCPPDQGEQAIYRLLHWRQGRFMFLADAAPDQETIHTDLRNLLLEGMRQIDEIADIQPLLPTANAVLYAERDSLRIAEVRVTVRQWRLLATVNGKRSISDLITLSGRDPKDVAHDVYHLLLVGLVSEHHDDAFLSQIVPEPTAESEWSDTASRTIPILSSRILALADGKRTMMEMRDALSCSDLDLIEEFRYLVRSRRVRCRSGQETFERYLL